MKVVLYLAIFVHYVQLDMISECNMASFYLELGCAPTQQVGNATTCPQAFTCPDLHPNATLCYYRGKTYSNREIIEQTSVNNPCSQACTCVTVPEPRFQCAAVDCVETFDTDLKEQCIYTYELDACCYTGSVCGKDAVEKLKTCEVDGQTYKEGQTFQPKNTRKTCICTAEWNGSVDNVTFCREVNCGIEIHYQKDLLDNCAPIFVSNSRSCPIGFECPSNTTTVRTVQRSQSTNMEQCTFGNMTLAVGDEVSAQEKCTRCSCEVPPFVTCMKQNTAGPCE